MPLFRALRSNSSTFGCMLLFSRGLTFTQIGRSFPHGLVITELPLRRYGHGRSFLSWQHHSMIRVARRESLKRQAISFSTSIASGFE